MPAPIKVSRDDVKRLAVYKQGLNQRPDASDKAALLRIIQRIGLLQLDSISVIARSHYLVMLARAGLYDPADLDALLGEGKVFESWAHALCQAPMSHYPWFHAWIKARGLQETRWHLDRLGDDFEQVVDFVRETVRRQGAMSSKDFESGPRDAAGWWNWKPAKIALEYLFDMGELMVSHRFNFQRYYDLSERVLAGKAEPSETTMAEYQRWAVAGGLRRLGIATSSQTADYYRLKKLPTAKVLAEMLGKGEALPVDVEGWKDGAYLHRDDLEALERIQQGQHAPGLTVFLSPFDNLFWDRERDLALWDFHYRIQVYTPKAKRDFGYYVMPILHGCELVGRIDPKVDRKRKRLIFHALRLERGVRYRATLGAALIGAIEEFMAFHGCDAFILESCEHGHLSRRLRRHFA